MCYNYSVNKAPGELKKRYKANFEKEEGFVPVFHTSGFTYSKLPVITDQDPGNIELLNWGPYTILEQRKRKGFSWKD